MRLTLCAAVVSLLAILWADDLAAQLEIREMDAAGALIGDNDPAAGTYRDWGGVPSGFPVWREFHVSNSGTTPITFGGGGNPVFAVTGANPAEFSVSWSVANPLPPGATGLFAVTFNNSSGLGYFSAAVEIYHNAIGSGTSPFELNVEADAVPGPFLRVNLGSPTGPQVNHQDPAGGTARDFGNQDINAGLSASITIFITNAGPTGFAITTPHMGGSWWTQYVLNTTGFSSYLIPGASTSFTVAFDPNTVGQKNADVLFSHSVGYQPSPFYVPVTGTATSTPAPVMELQQGTTSIADGGSFNVGVAAVSVPTSVSFLIRNTGGVTLNLTGSPTIQIGSQVSCTATVSVNPASTVVAPGGGVSFTLDITPQAAGAWSFVISIANNDPVRNPYDVTIFGNAVVVATELRMSIQPIDSQAGAVLAATPVVTLTNAAGNVDTSDSTTQVQVAITAGTGDPAASLGGTVTVTAINGVVTFSDLEISHGGTSYTLTFTDVTGPLGSVDSNPFNVSSPGGGGDDEEEEACSTGEGTGPAVPFALLAGCLVLLCRRRRSA